MKCPVVEVILIGDGMVVPVDVLKSYVKLVDVVDRPCPVKLSSMFDEGEGEVVRLYLIKI